MTRFRRQMRWAAPVLVLLILFVVIRQMQADFSRPAAPVRDEDSPSLLIPDDTLPALAYQLQRQAAVSGWTPGLHQQVGDLRMTVGDLPGAVAHWEAALSLDAAVHAVSLNRQLATAYLELERWTDAVNALQRLTALQPSESWARLQLGLLLAVVDPLAAQTHLAVAAQVPGYDAIAGELLRIMADAPDDLLRIGLVLMEHDYDSHAELAFRQAAVVNYPAPTALAYQALVRLWQGKDAQDAINRALLLGQDVPQVQYVYGLILREQGYYEASRNAFAAAISLDPDNPAYYAELSSAYRLLFDYEQAEYWLRVAVATSGNAPQFQELLAVFYAQEGYRLPPESLESARDAQAALPNDPDLLAGFAWAMHTLGDTSQALRDIDTALSLAPENPAANYYKARILADEGDLQEALRLMERAAASNSDYAPEAQRYVDEWAVALDESATRDASPTN